MYCAKQGQVAHCQIYVNATTFAILKQVASNLNQPLSIINGDLWLNHA